MSGVFATLALTGCAPGGDGFLAAGRESRILRDAALRAAPQDEDVFLCLMVRSERSERLEP
jgi:hypothetical protein